MSLSEPRAKREPLHRRTIEIVGYRRDDGLYDIEGRLLDRKDVEFPVGGRRKPPGEAVHDMWLRITVDRELRIVDAPASTDAMPYEGECGRITPDYSKLVGLSIGPGYLRHVKERLGGVHGCTHITELAASLATALGSLLPIFLAALAVIWLVGLGRINLGGAIFLSTAFLLALIPPILQSGLGVSNAITAFALIGGCALTTIPRRYIGRTLMAGLILTISSLIFDQFGPANRPTAEAMEIRWGMAITTLLVLGFFLIRDFPRLDVRTKIVIGILLSGGISIGALSILAINRLGIILSNISGRLETSVKLLAEEQLANT